MTLRSHFVAFGLYNLLEQKYKITYLICIAICEESIEHCSMNILGYSDCKRIYWPNVL